MARNDKVETELTGIKTELTEIKQLLRKSQEGEDKQEVDTLNIWGITFAVFGLGYIVSSLHYAVENPLNWWFTGFGVFIMIVALLSAMYRTGCFQTLRRKN